MRRRRFIERRAKIVAERGGEGVFVTGLNLDLFDKRRPVAVALRSRKNMSIRDR
ncbi:MAG: hypothetical protein RIA10_07335 [Amphiplicatus sp.]